MENKELVVWKGRAIPFGYTFDSEKKKLQVDPTAKKTLKLAYKMALAGSSIGSISVALNEKGYKTSTGKKWNYVTLSYNFAPNRLLFLSGFDKDGNKGNWETILTEEEAKKLLDKKIIKRIGSRPHKNSYLLTGLDILKCGYCGGPVKAVISPKVGKNDTKYYACTNRILYSKSRCGDSKSIQMDRIDNIVLNDLAKQRKNIKTIESYIKEVETQQKKEVNKKLKEVNKIISDAAKKGKGVESLNALTSEINELNNNASYLFDISNFKLINPNNLLIVDAPSKVVAIKSAIIAVFMFREHVEIQYIFPTDKELNNMVKIYYA